MVAAWCCSRFSCTAFLLLRTRREPCSLVAAWCCSADTCSSASTGTSSSRFCGAFSDPTSSHGVTAALPTAASCSRAANSAASIAFACSAASWRSKSSSGAASPPATPSSFSPSSSPPFCCGCGCGCGVADCRFFLLAENSEKRLLRGDAAFEGVAAAAAAAATAEAAASSPGSGSAFSSVSCCISSPPPARTSKKRVSPRASSCVAPSPAPSTTSVLPAGTGTPAPSATLGQRNVPGPSTYVVGTCCCAMRRTRSPVDRTGTRFWAATANASSSACVSRRCADDGGIVASPSAVVIGSTSALPLLPSPLRTMVWRVSGAVTGVGGSKSESAYSLPGVCAAAALAAAAATAAGAGKLTGVAGAAAAASTAGASSSDSKSSSL